MIKSGVEIGCNGKIFPDIYIGKSVKIGEECLAYSNVVIGGDGFGFASAGSRICEIPQIGKIEVGANATIDSAAVGVNKNRQWNKKIDNLSSGSAPVYNVQIGENCIIVAQLTEILRHRLTQSIKIRVLIES